MWLTDFYQNKLDPARTKRFNILHKSGHSGVGVPACVRACVRACGGGGGALALTSWCL
jgi:hypothetical protein